MLTLLPLKFAITTRSAYPKRIVLLVFPPSKVGDHLIVRRLPVGFGYPEIILSFQAFICSKDTACTKLYLDHCSKEAMPGKSPA